MRIGTDGRKIPEAAKRGPIGSLELGHELGAEGLFFRTVLEMSPTLDSGYLREIRQRADELGMYLETGLGKANPYANPEAPELRAIGDGDMLLGFRRMMEASAAIGIRELWSATANYKGQYFGRFAYDRFRTDVDWADQLEATRKFLMKLAPIARDLGVHINLETHEEITSFELVRLVEAVGPDALGIVFDTHNVLQRVEHPVWAAKRLAPYVRQTHVKDGVALRAPGGLASQIRDCGTGMIDLKTILPILAAANPNLNLSHENQDMTASPITRHGMIEIANPQFLAGHPDLTVEEFAAYTDLVDCFQQQVDKGEQPTLEQVAAGPFDFDAVCASIKRSLGYLRQVCTEADLPLEAAASARSQAA